jgi:redox-sensing transcriptional repressor
MYKKIPKNTIHRLPLYLSVLEQLAEESQNQEEFFHSVDLEKLLNIKNSVIRKDLSYFGEFGVKGKGYNIVRLKTALKEILDINVIKKTVIIGCGNIGTALMKYPYFTKINLNIAAGFDVNPKIINRKINKTPVYHIDRLVDFLNKEKIQFVILAVPVQASKFILQDLITKTDIHGIINFTPIYLKVPKHIKVINSYISAKILEMYFYLKNTNA